MPLEADLVKKAASAAPKKSSKLVLWAALGTLVIGAIAFVSSLKPAPKQAAAPASAITATAVVSTPVEVTPTLPSTMITESATIPAVTSSISNSTSSTATASPAMAAASGVAGMAARAASAAKALIPARRSSAPVSSPTTTPSPSSQPEQVNPQPTPAAAPANTSTATPARTPTTSAPRSSAGPSGPREACEGRVLLGFLNCVAEQCERPNFRNHPVCVERREMEERRRNQSTN